MKNFRNYLIDKIDNKIQHTDYTAGSGDSNYFSWDNLETDKEIVIEYDMDNDGEITILRDDSVELYYDSIEDAFENISDIVSLFEEQ